MLKICQKVIEYSFYALFLLVPLAFTSATSELFEMNKMWLVWALTILISISWLIKMILQKEFIFKRTPLDIPIVLFLISQIISSIFSLDRHTSFWGYYSRFNGGLLSIFSYTILYYAFLSNFQFKAKKFVKKLLGLSLISGTIVALWGLPSHFGYDPTCLLFRGTLDVSCWTADFLPKVRIFSTLGQPDWLAAYLAILIPITLAYFISGWKAKTQNWRLGAYLLLGILFYVDLLYTRARSGFIGIWVALIVFAIAYYFLGKDKYKFSLSWKNLYSPLPMFLAGLLIFTFIIGTPISQITPFTLEGVNRLAEKATQPKVAEKITSNDSAQPINLGGTESANIRLLVWKGALNAWKANPIFGTGVETFAFAYYKYKPAEHNTVSEWNFLYNKAHNEYLNYLATSGLLGLGSYLLMISYFLFLMIKKISKSEFLISNQAPNPNSQLGQLEIRSIRNLTIALIASYLSILITNFFGFSVVMTNVYLFMIPAFVFALSREEEDPIGNKAIKINTGTTIWQWTPVIFIFIAGLCMLYSLLRFWQADKAFALGYNLDRAGEYQQAYPNLIKAIELRSDEPVFKDELSLNNAIITAALVNQQTKDQSSKEQVLAVATNLAQTAINTSNEVISQYPNNVVFWKTRVRVFYTLSQADSRYLPRALDAIIKASLLAPNDANISYNLGVIHGQNGEIDKAIGVLEKTIELKPDYRDAHFGLGLFYQQKAVDKNGVVVNAEMKQKAIAQMQYILEKINPKDQGAKDSLDEWNK